MLDGEQRAGPEGVPGPPDVLSGDEVGMGSGGAFGREPEHLRAESREDKAVRRDAVGLEFVDVGHDRVVGLDVLADRLGVTGADAEQETAGVGGLDPRERRGDLVTVGLPHVDDAGRDDKLAGRGQQPVNDREIGAGRAAEP